MCKISEMCYGSKPCPSGGNRGAWSHTDLKFRNTPGERIRCHKKSKDHKAAVITLTTVRMNNRKQDSQRK